MQYNFHNEKYKQSDIGGIHKEQFREYSNAELYRNDVHPEMSDRNSYIELTEGGSDWYRFVRQAMECTQETTGKKVRKDAVVLCSTVESVPPSWDEDACNQYFLQKARWYELYLRDKAGVDENSMLSVCIHLDETTPHATYVWIPIKDGRLQAKNIVDSKFLTDLQADGQDYTMRWINEWNRNHADHQLELLEPIQQGSKKKHLAEQEYKAQQISRKVEEARNSLAVIQNEIGNLTEEKRELAQQKEIVEAAHIEYKERSQKADITRQQYENKLKALTGAPDVETYETIENENRTLKKELAEKNTLIAQLKTMAEHWKEQAEQWQKKFADIAGKLGRHLLTLLGFETEKDSVPEFPNSHFSAGIARLVKEVNRFDPRTLRVVPDNRDDDLFMITYTQDGDDMTLRRGFSTSRGAEEWKKNYVNMAKKLQKEHPERQRER